MKVTVHYDMSKLPDFPLSGFRLSEVGILTCAPPGSAATVGDVFLKGVGQSAYFARTGTYTSGSEGYRGRKLLPGERVVLELE